MINQAVHLSPLQNLAARWRVMGLIAVAIGRQISLMKKMRSTRGVQQANLLEAWLFTALVNLAADLTAHSAGAARRSRPDQRAFEHLASIYRALMALVLLVRHLRRALTARFEWLAALSAFAGRATFHRSSATG